MLSWVFFYEKKKKILVFASELRLKRIDAACGGGKTYRLKASWNSNYRSPGK